MVFCRQWHDYDQTKRTYHHHICGGDSDVLTWGVAAPQTMVEADAAPSLWWHVETKIIFAEGHVELYVGIVQEDVTRKNSS
jgi:hypothetical protein